jgi:hypothetical protein
LLQLDFRHSHGFNEPAFLALAESLPEIKVLQRLDFRWCTGLASAMPLLLAGLRENSSLFRFQLADCAPSSVPPSPVYTARCAGGWMLEMERLGYRNRFRSLIRAKRKTFPPRGVWSHALARVATVPDVIFEVLRFKPSLLPSEICKRLKIPTPKNKVHPSRVVGFVTIFSTAASRAKKRKRSGE